MYVPFFKVKKMSYLSWHKIFQLNKHFNNFDKNSMFVLFTVLHHTRWFLSFKMLLIENFHEYSTFLITSEKLYNMKL